MNQFIKEVDAVPPAIANDGAHREVADAVRPAPHLPVGFRSPLHHPVMRADEGDLSEALAEAWGLVMRSNRPPWLFRRGGQPTWIVHDDDSAPMTVAITEDRLRYMLAHLAKWFIMTRDGPKAAHPRLALVRSLLATPNPDLPVLSRISATPVFGRTGKLLTVPGYHADARLFYHPVPGFVVPPVPDRPTAGRDCICESARRGRDAGRFSIYRPRREGARGGHAAARLPSLDDQRADAAPPDRKAEPGNRCDAHDGRDLHRADRRGRLGHDGGLQRGGVAQKADVAAAPESVDHRHRQPAPAAELVGFGRRIDRTVLGRPHPRCVRNSPTADPFPVGGHGQQSGALQ